MKKAKLYQLFYFSFIFLLLFCPYIKVGGITIYFPYLFLFTLALFHLYLIFKRTIIPKDYSVFLSLYWIGGAWIFLIGFINGNLDNNILFGYIFGTLSILATFPIVQILSKKTDVDNVTLILKSVFFAGLIHAIIMILAFFWGAFRSALYSIVVLGDQGESFVEKMVRSPGLTTGGGDGLSVIQAISLCFGIYYFAEIKGRTRIIETILYIIAFLILLTSILLSARTGLILFLIFLFSLIFLRLLRFLASRVFDKVFLRKIISILLIFAVVIPIGFVFLLESDYSRFAFRASELFLNYFAEGEITTSSTERLKEMYFLPGTIDHVLFGDGNFGRDPKLHQISSDVGYVRMIFGVGILGCIILFLPLIFSAFIAIKNLTHNKHLAILLMFVIFTILLVNIKILYYFESREGFKVLFLLLATTCMIKRTPQSCI